MKCVKCGEVAEFILDGNSLCWPHFRKDARSVLESWDQAWINSENED